MSPRTYFHAASGVAQIKKVHVQVLDRGICSKSTFLSESASSRLSYRWLIFNHYKVAHFCFLPYLYWIELLLYLVRKDSSQTHSHYHHSQYLNSRKKNEVTNTALHDIYYSEKTLPRHMRTKLAQLRANKSLLLQRYLHTVNPNTFTP